ncbi:MAG: chemotaxis protein CheD [Thermoprotei archaeon]|nr:chemotaxis protein CheD [Thermoprotei archaeon]
MHLRLMTVNRITDRDGCIAVNIGEYKVGYGNVKLATWGLGSCVAIILYDGGRSLGGLGHALLPKPSSEHNTLNFRKRYATTLIDLMVNRMIALGSEIADMEAALIGGARVIPNLNSHIGERNAIAAKERLREWGIKIAFQDIGGRSGRNVLFYVRDGKVLVAYTLRKGFR